MTRNRQGRTRYRTRPSAEVLEGRALLATLTVNSTADGDSRDAGLTLREAIEVSNGTLPISSLSPLEQAQISGALGVPNSVAFDIPGGAGDVRTIALFSDLPAITQPLVIDGFTQTGSKANTSTGADNGVRLIELTQGAPGLTAAVLRFNVGGSSVSGLVINGFTSVPALVDIEPTKAGAVAVQGNFLGVTTAGLAGAASPASGVVVGGLSSGSAVGGSGPGARNVIAGGSAGASPGPALWIKDLAANTGVQGNFIGVNATGVAALPSTSLGVLVGSAASGAAVVGNVIAGNGAGGVYVGGSGATVQGNNIGVGVNSTTALGNKGVGVAALAGVSGLNINSNLIANNAADGVLVQGAVGGSPAAVRVAILGNSIFNNAGLGINVQTGANGGVSAPVLSNPTITSTSTTVTGTLSGLPGSNYRVEFYTNPAADPSGFGEGQTFLGSITVNTGSSGQAPAFQFSVAADLTGQAITATATDPQNNTSAFARDVPNSATKPQPSTLVLTATPQTVAPNKPVTLVAFVTARNGADPAGGTVTFYDGTSVLGTVAVAANGTATLATSFSTPGFHALAGAYGGNAATAGSTGTRVVAVTTGTPGENGGPNNVPGQPVSPYVVGLARYGVHSQATSVVLSFNMPLDPARARNLANYAIYDATGRPIPLARVIYVPGTQTVTIVPRVRLNAYRLYTVTANGAPPTGLASVAGQPLDGSGIGRPGSLYAAPLVGLPLPKKVRRG